MLNKCYFEPCLLQVLKTFCILISVINPIGLTEQNDVYYFTLIRHSDSYHITI